MLMHSRGLQRKKHKMKKCLTKRNVYNGRSIMKFEDGGRGGGGGGGAVAVAVINVVSRRRVMAETCSW